MSVFLYFTVPSPFPYNVLRLHTFPRFITRSKKKRKKRMGERREKLLQLMQQIFFVSVCFTTFQHLIFVSFRIPLSSLALSLCFYVIYILAFLFCKVGLFMCDLFCNLFLSPTFSLFLTYPRSLSLSVCEGNGWVFLYTFACSILCCFAYIAFFFQ